MQAGRHETHHQCVHLLSTSPALYNVRRPASKWTAGSGPSCLRHYLLFMRSASGRHGAQRQMATALRKKEPTWTTGPTCVLGVSMGACNIKEHVPLKGYATYRNATPTPRELEWLPTLCSVSGPTEDRRVATRGEIEKLGMRKWSPTGAMHTQRAALMGYPSGGMNQR